MAESVERAGVPVMMPSDVTLTVSRTGMPGAAARLFCAALIVSVMITSVTSGRAASWTPMSVARLLAASTPASEDSARVIPPTTTFVIFVRAYWSRSAAISSRRDVRVTTISSSTAAQFCIACSERTSTGTPPTSIISLSRPIRLDEPAASTTIVQNGLPPSFALIFP